MFFPYRARITLYRFPVITVLVSLLCLGIFIAQYMNQRSLFRSTAAYCDQAVGRDFRHVLTRLTGSADTNHCAMVMLALYHARDAETEIERLAARLGGATPGVGNADLRSYYADLIRDTYRGFQRAAPANLTARLWYPPDSWNPMRMLSAAVAHGSWMHLIGNLFFFFAFAATVEILLGPLLYMGVLVALALGTHSVYSLAMLGRPEALPTLGLSGVVMGIIALFTYFLPRAKISCFIWLIVLFRRFAIPAWLLAVWYIGWDVYAQVSGGGDSGINLVAHLSGAALGLLIGITFFRTKRHWARELVAD
jgi:membrane associated rhomboid family serine protease